MQAVLDTLGSLGSANEIGQAVSQLMPGFSGGGAQVALGLAGSSGSQVVSERMSGGQGLSSGDPLFKDRMVWAQPFYSWTDQNERKGVAGYTADSHGLALGADGKVNEQWRIGAALSLAKGEVDGDSPVTRNNLEINTYQLTLYATDQLSKATSLNLQAGFGANDNDSSRHIVFGGLDRIANGDYTSWHTLLDAELEHRYTVSEKASVASYLRAQYTYVNVEDYTETGAGAINLHMDDNNEDSLVLTVGGRGAYAFTEQTKLTGHLGAGYDLMASQSSVTASFAGGGPAFVTEGLDPASFVLQGGLGLEMLTANGLTVTARYDVDGREDYTNQVASLKFQMPF
jgi:outer membrane autotransporter protein